MKIMCVLACTLIIMLKDLLITESQVKEWIINSRHRGFELSIYFSDQSHQQIKKVLVSEDGNLIFHIICNNQ
jgi:hypothetical protein